MEDKAKLNLCGLTRKEAAELLGVSVYTVRSYTLGERPYTEAQQALLVSAGTGLKIEGVYTDGTKVDVLEARDRIHEVSGPYTAAPRIQSVNWSGKLYDLSEWAASKVDWKPSMPRDDAAYPVSWDKAEWDLMPDGYARGIPVDDARMRQVYRTPGSYFRLIDKQLGRTFAMRTTKEDFDNAGLDKLGLPNFDKVGPKVRERLMSEKQVGKPQ